MVLKVKASSERLTPHLVWPRPAGPPAFVACKLLPALGIPCG